MPKDLNPANRLFGGQMMSWIDEAAAMYAMCQTESQNIVTAKVSEINFTQPVMQGDFLIFEASMVKVGTSSFTVAIDVYKKILPHEKMESLLMVCNCCLTFVTIDPKTGKGIPHGMKL